jgi:GNAT superfamily N-acetyltransferase
MMPLKLRYAYLEDASQISDIHRSHVTRWYRKLGAEQFEVPYGSLSLGERWGFGGPWMSVETCSIHLNNLLLQDQAAIVAQKGDMLVGEMELFLGEEGAVYGKNLHIGLLYVRKGFTGQGIGKALVDKALEMAARWKCDTVTVASGPEREGFYERCGFGRSGTMVEIEAVTGAYDVDVSRLRPPSNIRSFTRGMPMLIGRLQSSAFHLFEQFDSYAVPEIILIVRDRAFVKVNGHPSMLAFVKGETRAEVYGWSGGATAGELALAALSILRKQGYEQANILLAADDYMAMADSVDAAVKGSRSILLRGLK